MHIFACFSFYCYYYSSQPCEMDLGKIWETTNQLNLTLAFNILIKGLSVQNIHIFFGGGSLEKGLFRSTLSTS